MWLSPCTKSPPSIMHPRVRRDDRDVKLSPPTIRRVIPAESTCIEGREKMSLGASDSTHRSDWRRPRRGQGAHKVKCRGRGRWQDRVELESHAAMRLPRGPARSRAYGVWRGMEIRDPDRDRPSQWPIIGGGTTRNHVPGEGACAAEAWTGSLSPLYCASAECAMRRVRSTLHTVG